MPAVQNWNNPEVHTLYYGIGLMVKMKLSVAARIDWVTMGRAATKGLRWTQITQPNVETGLRNCMEVAR